MFILHKIPTSWTIYDKNTNVFFHERDFFDMPKNAPNSSEKQHRKKTLWFERWKMARRINATHSLVIQGISKIDWHTDPWQRTTLKKWQGSPPEIIDDDDDSKWPHNYHISRAYVPHLEKVYSNLRQQLKRKPEDKMECLFLKDSRQLGCIFQDIEPPDSLPILRKCTKIMWSSRRERFTKAMLRHANIRESKGPSLGVIQVKKILISEVRTHPKLRIGLRRRLKDRSDVPAETRGEWPKVSLRSLKRTNLRLSHLRKFGVSQHHPQ